jgi:hypothetical protein
LLEAMVAIASAVPSADALVAKGTIVKGLVDKGLARGAAEFGMSVDEDAGTDAFTCLRTIAFVCFGTDARGLIKVLSPSHPPLATNLPWSTTRFSALRPASPTEPSRPCPLGALWAGALAVAL